MTTVILSVPGISCEHCERAVTAALTKENGVASVSVDIPAKTVRLAYDPQVVSLERLTAVLAEEDYPVASVTPA
ncbi:MAG: cation transporter [Dehalococcoidia bacterium]|nr:cation transporter [Dehalococcoidia bacterium]